MVTLFIGVVFLLLLWVVSTRRPAGIPPGPGLTLPLLGHLHLISSDMRKQCMAWRHQYGDVFSLYMGGQLLIVLCGYDAIKEALVKHANALSDRPKMIVTDKIVKNRGVVFSSGATWKEQRKVTLEILRSVKKSLADSIRQEVSKFLTFMATSRGEPSDFSTLITISISNNMCSLVFGRRFEYDDPQFADYLALTAENFRFLGSTAILNYFPWLSVLPGDFFHAKKVIHNVNEMMENFLKPLIQQHLDTYEDKDKNDFINAYIKEMHKRCDQGQSTTINEDNLLFVTCDLFIAGTESSSNALQWALLFFLHYPEVQEKCFQEVVQVVSRERQPSIEDIQKMPYVQATVMEVLRCSDIIPFGVQHGVAYDVTFRGYKIPKNSVIVPFLHSVLKDPEVWPDPEVFKPERFIGPNGTLMRREDLIPMSIGRRKCLGEKIAHMELLLYLSAMVQQFQFLPPQDGHLPSLRGIVGLSHTPQHFCVRAVPRHVI